MENARYNERLTPEAIETRARANYTRADIVTPRVAGRAYTTFYAVYTTPEGEVADRIYCYSDMLLADRIPPGKYGAARRKQIAERVKS